MIKNTKNNYEKYKRTFEKKNKDECRTVFF